MEKKTLASKMLDIMQDCDNVPKKGHNNAQNYDYVRAADVSDYVRKLLVKHRVICVPAFAAADDTQYQTKSGSQMTLTRLKLGFNFIDADNDKDIISIETYGYGSDAGDKSIYKALTGAHKYALMQAFCIGTNDDAEDDSGSSNMPPVQRIATSGSVSPNTVKNVAVQTADSLPKMPGTFYYKVPWEEKDEWTPVLKRAKARWNPGNKHWESQTKVMGMDRYCTNLPKSQPKPTEVAFSMDDEDPGLGEPNI